MFVEMIHKKKRCISQKAGMQDKLLKNMLTFFQNVNEDIATEREVYEQSRQGLDTMYTESQKKLMEETQAREVCLLS